MGNTMLYVTRITFCVFVVFAMCLLGMLFYARTAGQQKPIIIYQKAAPCASAASVRGAEVEVTSQSKASSTTLTTRASFEAPQRTTEEQQHLFCFFNKSAPASFDVSKIPVGLCTHLVYCAVGIDSSTFTIRLTDSEQSKIERFAAFGQPSKLLVLVGQSRQDWRAYLDIASDRHLARDFGLKVRSWLQEQNLDGVVIDWPNGEEQQAMTELVSGVKRAMGDDQLLAVLLPHDQRRRRAAFDVRGLVVLADFLLFRMYGSHGLRRTEFPITEEDVALFPKAVRSETGREAFRKACMILPLAGLKFLRGKVSRGRGSRDRAGHLAGSLGYRHLCTANWTRARAGHYGSTASRGAVWVGYHDGAQLAGIVRVARRKHGVRCFGLWALEDDDFRATCSATRFPLLRAVAGECKASSKHARLRSQ
ncbi:hypothetical protein V5799_008081 [Amblyomma americanum]|uniref:GH18 domain-containing protein n=1 Tax=Amblyomma americanum TaxID=6943 RepID=A0AAQ4FE47_AMBAM